MANGTYDPSGWIARWMGTTPQYPSYAPDITPPPAPRWLPRFAPRQVAGQPITRQRIPTPSGQLWARTPWSERQGLGGYLEWAGYDPLQDILDRMQMMRPVTPPGISGRRWMPYRQY